MFSLVGIVFLSILAVLITYNAPYLKISQEKLQKKDELVDAVIVSIGMYIVCLLISAYIWYQSPYSPTLTDARFDD